MIGVGVVILLTGCFRMAGRMDVRPEMLPGPAPRNPGQVLGRLHWRRELEIACGAEHVRAERAGLCCTADVTRVRCAACLALVPANAYEPANP